MMICFLGFAYSNYGYQILQNSGYTQIPIIEQLIMLVVAGSHIHQNNKRDLEPVSNPKFT
jgi:hypothetical protein